jgi:hypothetical protein
VKVFDKFWLKIDLNRSSPGWKKMQTMQTKISNNNIWVALQILGYVL